MNENNVLVDTCIWSIVLRHRHHVDHPLIPEFTHLAQQKRLLMLGAIRQEVLSGIREPQRFEWLRQRLRAFPDFPVSLEDYETAAEFYNRCRAKGVQGSLIDFLLCAVSQRHQLPIFTTDKDFEYFQKHIAFEWYSFSTTPSTTPEQFKNSSKGRQGLNLWKRRLDWGGSRNVVEPGRVRHRLIVAHHFKEGGQLNPCPPYTD